jgi:hypothetical protein
MKHQDIAKLSCHYIYFRLPPAACMTLGITNISFDPGSKQIATGYSSVAYLASMKTRSLKELGLAAHAHSGG